MPRIHAISAKGIQNELEQTKQFIADMMLGGCTVKPNFLRKIRLYWVLMYRVVSCAIETAINDSRIDWGVLPEHIWLKHDIEDLLQIVGFLMRSSKPT